MTEQDAQKSEGLGLVRWWLIHTAEAQGLSWETVADRVGATLDAVRSWAEGRSMPDPASFRALAELLGTPSHPPGAEPDVDAPIEPYGFVIAGNGLGIGKCVEVGAETAHVEYFDTVAHRPSRDLPLDALTRVRLSSQTRCYVRDPDAERWKMGRVNRLEGGDRMIELPDQEVQRVDDEHLFVRWARPVEDPTETLKQKSQETVFFRNRRSPFAQSLIEQRAASRGASGLLSSSITLYRHQVNVVRRVLEDPVPRYLLADDVGLGKAVEAGAIVRQFLIDHGGGTVRVLAPAVLCDQWRRELDEKFDLDALPGTVSVHPLEDVRDVTTDPAPDALVIDEAHTAVAGAFEDADGADFDALAEWAHASDCLLLLSDLPAHRPEKELLAMLHLLDPAVYALDDLEAFRLRAEKRREAGGMLQNLVESANASREDASREDASGEDATSLRSALDEVRAAFPEDDALQAEADALETAVNASPEDAAARDRAVRAIRLHVQDRFSLPPRMLRTRRAEVDPSIGADRQAPTFPEYAMDPREEEVHDGIDRWRQSAQSASDGDADREASYGRLFRLLVEAGMSDLNLLRDVVRARLSGPASEGVERDLSQDLSEESLDALRTTPRYDGEEEILVAVEQAAQPDASLDEDAFVLQKEEWLEQFVRRHVKNDEGTRLAVFTTFPSVAQHLARRLRDALGDERVALHSAVDAPERAQDDVRRFREHDRCRILVCDRSAEAGLNLSFVDHLVHYDLPWSPNRIERRTGRLDRIGRDGRPMSTHVYVGPEVERGSIYEAWYRVLKDGFGVFDRSIAELRWLADEIEADLVRDRFRSGSEHVDAAVETVRDAVDRERDDIDRQHAFDPFRVESADDAFYDDLQQLEAQSRTHASHVHGWVSDALQFHVRKKPYPDGLMQYRPNFKGRTLIPLDTVLNRFLPRSEKPFAYDRARAVDSRSRVGHAASLMRIGHPFLDGLRDYFEWDDRGRAYAIWRQSRDWDALGKDDRLFFRFELVVEATVGSADDVDAGTQAALQRRADAFFPPRVETVITDRDGSVVENEGLAALVAERPRRVQDGGTDANVKGDRVHVLDAFVDPPDWPDHCERARASAVDALRQRDDLVRQSEDADRAVEANAQRRMRRLRLRAGAERESDAHARVYRERAQQEETAASRVRQSIQAPTVRVDSVGVVILSGSAIPIPDA